VIKLLILRSIRSILLHRFRYILWFTRLLLRISNFITYLVFLGTFYCIFSRRFLFCYLLIILSFSLLFLISFLFLWFGNLSFLLLWLWFDFLTGLNFRFCKFSRVISLLFFSRCCIWLLGLLPVSLRLLLFLLFFLFISSFRKKVFSFLFLFFLADRHASNIWFNYRCSSTFDRFTRVTRVEWHSWLSDFSALLIKIWVTQLFVNLYLSVCLSLVSTFGRLRCFWYLVFRIGNFLSFFGFLRWFCSFLSFSSLDGILGCWFCFLRLNNIFRFVLIRFRMIHLIWFGWIHCYLSQWYICL
jgi:hypothetical protein